MHTSSQFSHSHWRALVVLAAFVSPTAVRAQLADLDGGVRDASNDAALPASPLIPPRIRRSVSPIYPEGHSQSGSDFAVILSVVVSTEGRASEVQVLESAGTEFDARAVQAVRQWAFDPARQNGTAVPSRVRIAVHFDAPVGAHSHEALGRAPHRKPDEHRALATGPKTGSASVRLGATAVTHPSDRRPKPRAASDFVLERDVLEAAPTRDSGDLLSRAPGFFVTRTEGDAVAQSVMLRGFDAEHGQDIEFAAAGIPINQPSHLHGQGYADLAFIPPEVVRSVRVTEGVYDPRQGDFAVAGTVDFDLAVPERGVHLRSGYGSFATQRHSLVWAPAGEPEETFGAFVFRKSDGFGQNRASQSASAMAQHAFTFGKLHAVLHASAYGARANLAGVLRRDDIESGKVDFYDVYPNATAQSQSALAARTQLGLTVDTHGDRGSYAALGVWLMFNDFRIRENFTGFTQRSQINPDWVGRGDLIEQGNQAWSLGLRSRYRSPEWVLNSWARGFGEVGVSGRLDLIDQQQNLLEAPQNETWDQRVDASIQGADVGAWADLDWKFTRFFRVKGGMRADVLYYDVNDRLGNFIPRYRRDTFIVGFRRTALGLAAGPRATLEFSPLSWFTALAAYGEGYRSPQARQLEEGESAPFAKVRSAELGARATLGARGETTISAAAYWTSLSLDLAFDATEGRLSRIGPTTRLGGVVHAVTRPLPGLVTSLSATWVRATLDEPPPPTAEDPTPPYQSGQRLPFVPPLVVRADASYEHALFTVAGKPLFGRLGLGFSALSARPLPYDQFADPVALLDASLSVRYRMLSVSLDLYNALDAQYAAQEFVHVSNWTPSELPSRVPARHITAGPPRTFFATLGLDL